MSKQVSAPYGMQPGSIVFLTAGGTVRHQRDAKADHLRDAVKFTIVGQPRGGWFLIEDLGAVNPGLAERRNALLTADRAASRRSTKSNAKPRSHVA